MKKSLVLFAFVASFGAYGCSATCEDACNNTFECAGKLGVSTEGNANSCISSCNQGAYQGCTEEQNQEVIDCLAEMTCENEVAFTGEMLSCIAICR